ncbi:class II fructose-bisphosphatase [Exiguobacterium sp. RIT452]|jgi:fructose-1,6-bisphosphatase II|uniref:Fructose-1,6-bisphosphatase n=1 Tax=Exiguobacterium undae TaxID=169177 RepID=A0ABX2V8X2_9BACL|nr:MULTISPECIES: class II fructose-bisphosphatase [Exiguobacterium]OAN14657.1 fructose 1,6-bisphosphatase [Exiguobacterium undae]RJP00865.1 class II fructose-bisphosphatase [Exiguobacterium sp. RIT452]
MERELALEIVRATEAAALASAKWIGRGKKNEADDAATTAMREVLNTVNMAGTVVIGEGELDEAPMLFIGEQVGTSNGPVVDIAVDPLEGTNIVAKGLGNAMVVIAVADEGALLHAPDMYMDKLTVGPNLKGHVSLDDPLEVIIQKAAELNQKRIEDVTVIMQDRPRHDHFREAAMRVGARVRLFEDGDVSAGIAPLSPSTGIDIFIGTGGAPEGVITAAAVKAMGGDMQARLHPMNEEETARVIRMGLADPLQLLTLDDLIKSDDCIFAATGVTTGEMLDGVRFLTDDIVETTSLVMRSKTRTIRKVIAEHSLSRKPYLQKVPQTL